MKNEIKKILDDEVWASGMDVQEITDKIYEVITKSLEQMITKKQWLKLVSKIEQTFEDEFKAEFNSPELMYPLVKRLLQQHDVSGSVDMKPKKEPRTKECGTCWGGGKIDVDGDMRTVDCWTCGGSGRLKI